MNTFKAFGTPHPSRFLSVCSVLAHVFFCYVLLDKKKYLFCSLVSTDFTLVSLCLCALYDFLSSLSDLLFFFFFFLHIYLKKVTIRSTSHSQGRKLSGCFYLSLICSTVSVFHIFKYSLYEGHARKRHVCPSVCVCIMFTAGLFKCVLVCILPVTFIVWFYICVCYQAFRL